MSDGLFDDTENLEESKAFAESGASKKTVFLLDSYGDRKSVV